ncbi:unnamed protein product [Microthlaspi erraticum]|uniref:Uncharacterized protein n=2 Tax=Microthlaspi erraticum TaxID=1685480 RepID=A0A6D2II32_9BRAS|nr:unnamed protein product [Microthlaspi erraticum]
MKRICKKKRSSSIELRIELRLKLKMECRKALTWRIGLLQKLTKWQGKAMDKMQKSMDKMVTPHHSKETPCPRASQSLFFRAKGRRRQHAEKEEDFQGQTLQLDHRTRSSPNRGNSTRRADGRADLEEPQFEDPGFEYDPMPYQEPPRSRWNPYGQYELPMLHQGQGSHTHFNDEEEEEEEPQARSSEPQEATPVAWSAPDGRLPSPDHDLVSQFFGGH